MTPWQGIFDRLLTPAGREPATERPPFSQQGTPQFWRQDGTGSQPARSYGVSGASPALAICSSSSGVVALARVDEGFDEVPAPVRNARRPRSTRSRSPRPFGGARRVSDQSAFGDEARAALTADIRPKPLGLDAQAIL
jgi:hypothetical protein